MNKKASVQDVGWAMIFFFTAVVMFLVVTYAFGQYTLKAKLVPAINSSAVTVATLDTTNELTKRFDYISLGVLLGFTMAIIITSWLVSGHPIFMFIYSIFLIVLIIASSIFSYVWNKLSSTALLSSTVTTHFPIGNYILNNFPVFITIIGFLAMIIMFAKPQGDGL